MIEIDVIEIFRDDVLRFKFDVGFELSRFLYRHLNFFHDDRAPWNRGNDIFGTDAVFSDQRANRIDHRLGINHHIVLDGVVGQRHRGQFDDEIAGAIDRGFHQLDRTRTDIEGDVAVIAAQRFEETEVQIFPEGCHGLLFEQRMLLLDGQTEGQ